MSDPTGLNQKVQTVLENFITQLSALSSIDASIDAIRGVELLTLGDVVSQLDAIRSEQATFRGEATDLLNAIAASTGLLPVGSTDTVLELLTDTRDRLGIPTGDATTTINGLLLQIMRLSRCGCPPEPPDLTDPEAPCDTPFVSVPALSRTIEEFPGRIFAGWQDPVPDGFALTNWLLEPAPPAEVVRSGDLPGWFMYVQSPARFFTINPVTTNVLPTNVWLPIDGYNNAMAISVEAPNDLIVYVCVPEPVTWTDCITLESTLGTYSTDAPFSLELQVVPLGTIPDQVTGQSWFSGGNEHAIDVLDTVALENWNGVTITLLSGAGARVSWLDTGGNLGGTNLDSIGADHTFTFDTTMVVIANFQVGSPADDPFSIELCPPA